MEIGQGLLSLDAATASHTFSDNKNSEGKGKHKEDRSASQEYRGSTKSSVSRTFVTREIGLSSGGVYVGLASFGLHVSIAASA